MTKIFRSFWTAGIIGASILAAISWQWIDVPAAWFFRSYADHVVVRLFSTVTDLASAFIWYPLAIAGSVYAYARWKAGYILHSQWLMERRAWSFMIAGMFISSMVKNFLKLAIGRDRPGALFEDGVLDLQPFNQQLNNAGFPSGHSQSICSAMLALAIVYPPLRPICLLLAAIVMTSRIVIGAHFVSDVIAGGLVGIVTVLLCRKWFERGGQTVTLTKGAAAAGGGNV